MGGCSMLLEGNVPFAHIDVVPAVKDAFKPPAGAVMNADHILFHAILKAGLTGKIRHHQLYARKNIIEPKICTAIVHRICGMADKGCRPWCYNFIFQVVQLLHRVSPRFHRSRSSGNRLTGKRMARGFEYRAPRLRKAFPM